MNVAVISQDSYERNKIRPLKSIFVKIFWWSIARRHYNDSTRKEFGEEPLEDHGIANVSHLIIRKF